MPPFAIRRATLQTRVGLDAQTTSSSCCKQQARINRFHDLKGDLANKIDDSELEINFETSRIGKRSLTLKTSAFPILTSPF